MKLTMQPQERHCQNLPKTSRLFKITAMHRCKQQSLCPFMTIEFIYIINSFMESLYIQCGRKRPRLFFRVNKFVTVNGRKACDISKDFEFCLEKV